MYYLFYGREKRHVPFSLIAKYYPILLLKDEILEFFHILHPLNIRDHRRLRNILLLNNTTFDNNIIIKSVYEDQVNRMLFIVYARIRVHPVFCIYNKRVKRENSTNYFLHIFIILPSLYYIVIIFSRHAHYQLHNS